MSDFREQVRALRQRIANLFDCWPWYIRLSVARRQSDLSAGEKARLALKQYGLALPLALAGSVVWFALVGAWYAFLIVVGVAGALIASLS